MPSFADTARSAAPPEEGGTRIDVLVDIPEQEAARLDQQREDIRRSLVRLAEVAAVAPL